MPQDMKVWRESARRKLKEQLGGRCVDCGRTEAEVRLEFSHVVPLTPEQDEYRARIGVHSRLVLYRKEAAENLLTLRCHSCNIKQSKEPKQGFFSFSNPTLIPF